MLSPITNSPCQRPRSLQIGEFPLLLLPPAISLNLNSFNQVVIISVLTGFEASKLVLTRGTTLRNGRIASSNRCVEVCTSSAKVQRVLFTRFIHFSRLNTQLLPFDIICMRTSRNCRYLIDSRLCLQSALTYNIGQIQHYQSNR